MPVTLRRCCIACAKAKRRCDLQLPRCTRCSGKGLQCGYVNEPSSHESSQHPSDMVPSPDRLQHSINSHSGLCSVANRHPVSFSVRSSLLESSLSVVRPSAPEVALTLDQATVRSLLTGLRSFLTMFVRSGGTPFMHPRLYDRGLPYVIRDMHTICTSYLKRTDDNHYAFFWLLGCRVHETIRHADETGSFEEILASVQALMLAQILRLFDGNAHQRTLAELHLVPLSQLTHRLWQEAPIELPNSMSPWQAWIFAESVRRTILVSHILRGAYSTIKRGYFIHTSFVEALPFDVRTSLWDAPSADAWESSAPALRPALASYREYTDMWENGQIRDTRAFDKMLLVACKGQENVEAGLSAGLNEVRS